MRTLSAGLLAAFALSLLAGCPKSGDAAQAQLAESDPLAAASQAKAAGKPEEAIGYCRRALAKSPRSLDAWRLLVQLA